MDPEMVSQGPSPTQCFLSALLWDQAWGHRQKDEPWVPNLEGKNVVLWRFWRSFTTSESFSERPNNLFPWFWVLYVNTHQMPLKHNEEALVRKQQESGRETDPAFACLWPEYNSLVRSVSFDTFIWLNQEDLTLGNVPISQAKWIHKHYLWPFCLVCF